MFHLKLPVLPENWRKLIHVLNVPLGWLSLLLFLFALYQFFSAFSKFLRSFRRNLSEMPWKRSDLRHEAGRKVFIGIGIGVFAAGTGWIGYLTNHPFQDVSHLTQAGEFSITRSPTGVMHYRFIPAVDSLAPLRGSSRVQKVSLVGAFVACPSWFRWVLWSSRHEVLGFHVERHSMDFASQETLGKTWVSRTDPGFKIIKAITAIIPVCRTYIRASPAVSEPGRYAVLASSSGYVLTPL